MPYTNKQHRGPLLPTATGIFSVEATGSRRLTAGSVEAQSRHRNRAGDMQIDRRFLSLGFFLVSLCFTVLSRLASVTRSKEHFYRL